MELGDKGIKTGIISTLHMFKNVEESCNMMRGEMENFKKDHNRTSTDKKYNIWNEKNSLDGVLVC